MLSNSFLKLKSNRGRDGIIHSDNLNSYFYVSDFIGDIDGLWSNGFHLFNSFHPDIKGDKIIESKTNTPVGFQISFYKNNSVNCYLLNNNEGFIIEMIKDRSLFKINKNLILTFNIKRDFLVIEKNRKSIVIEYDKPNREGFEIPKLYLSINTTNNSSFENIGITDDSIKFEIKSGETSDQNTELYLYYHKDKDKLKKDVNANITKLETLKKHQIKNAFLPLKYINVQTENNNINKALAWAIITSSSFVMQKVGNLGIWAGFHWFDNNWGRDTFISLPGISLVSGRYEEAWHIIETFIKRQSLDKKSKDYGKIPNVIFNEDKILYNTSDATPLLIREVYEYFLYSGDYNSILQIINNILIAIDNVYLLKKDNHNFLSHPDSDDWMDAKKDGEISYSPRGDKAIEIQALWYTALYSGSMLLKNIIRLNTQNIPTPGNFDMDNLKQKEKEYEEEAIKLKSSIKKNFCTSSSPFMYDHINKDGTKDNKIRPNGLLAIYYSNLIGIPKLFEDEFCIEYLKDTHSKIVYTHGVSSLDNTDEDFHPVHINENYHKDAAYHNGTNWLWLSGAYVSAACRYDLQNISFIQTQNLTTQLLSTGALGTLSELNDPYIDSKLGINPSGTYSQAWSIAEYCRSFLQDYIGIKPDVPNRTLYFTPNIPNSLGSVKLTFRYGFYESISIYARISKKTSRIAYIDIKGVDIKKPIKIVCMFNIGNSKNEKKVLEISVSLNKQNDSFRAGFDYVDENNVKLKEFGVVNNCEILSLSTNIQKYNDIILDKVKFSKKITDKEFQCYNTIKNKDYLEKKIIKKKV